MLGATGALAQPVGASVIAGQAQVSTAGATTFVNQSTAKAIINWQDFSVGQGAAVQFNQPNASAITLNRVIGSGISTIDGAIRANGQVWLLNPNGLLFGNGASINVGGLLATTSDIANQDFVEGRYNFSGGRGGIVNNGTIKASDGGSVILSAPSVINRGLIQANAGHVVLGGTDTFTVDFNGDHLLNYAVGASSQTGQVTNSGTVSAAGGTVLMTVRAASGVQDAVINNTGMVEATTARSVNGEIILDAGDGTATTSGTLDASGKGGSETGGTVKVLGGAAAVADNAVIDVSGTRGGGTVLIGGNFHGAGTEIHARNTSIGKATIKADATVLGNGGNVAVWSDGTTDFAGSISARGGAIGGNGGQVETSGHNLNIAPGATVNALAPYGVTGSWLLDPADIDIEPTGVSAVGGETFASNNFSGTSTIQATTIDTALQTADLSLQASNDITVNAAVTINSAGTAGRTLTLEAGRSILLNQDISYAGGNVVMIAASLDPGVNATYRQAFPAFISSVSSVTGGIQAARVDLILNSNGVDGSLIGTVGTNAPFLVEVSSPTYIKTLGANAYLSVPDGTATSFALGNSANTNAVDLGTGSLSIKAAGVTQSAPVLSNNLTITLPNSISSGNPVTLTNTSNAITGFVNIAAMGRSANGAPYVQLTNSQSLTLAAISTISNTTGDTGPRGAASFTTTSGNISLTGAVNVSGLTFTSAGSITEIGAPAIITSFSVTDASQPGSTGITLSSVGAITLANANQIAQVVGPTGNGSETQVTRPGLLSVNISGAGDANLNFTSNLGVLQSSIANGALTLTTTGTYTLFNVAGSTVILNKGIQVMAPLSASGLITLNSDGDITQTSSGVITASSIAFTNTVNTSSILLNTANNAISSATLLAGVNVSLFDTGNLTLTAIKGSTGGTSTPSGIVAVQATGNLTLATPGSGATVGSPTLVLLHAGGSIFGGTGTGVSAPTMSLIADGGTIGTAASPLGIATNNLAVRTSANKDINLSAVQFNSAPLTLTTVATTTNGNIGNTNNAGINSGTGNVAILGTGALTFNGSNANGNSITAANLRLSGFAAVTVTGASISGLSASSAGAITVSTLGAFQINNLTGGVGISTTGAVTLNSLGSISSAGGTAGSIAAGTLTASINTSGGSGLFLGNSSNAVTGSITLNAPGAITFFNSVNTNIFRADYIPSQTAVAAQSVDIEAFGASNPTLTIGAGANQNGLSIAGGNVTLRGAGGISQSGTGLVSGSTISMFSGFGGIGTTSAPILVQAGGSILANTVNRNINLAFSLQPGATSSTIGLGLPGNSTGFSAGTGNISISAPSVLVVGNATITAGSLNILSSAGVILGDAEVTTLSAAASGGGTIDITSLNGFQLNNPNGGPAIQTTGDVSLSVILGSLTQAPGASGAIVGGTLSSFAVGSNILSNSANAIAGNVMIGSLGDVTFVNSLTTHLVIALAGGTLTVQSAGDLELVAGPTIASLSSGQGLTLNDTNVLSASILSQIGSTIVSFRTGGDGIVLAAGGNFINHAGANALFLPGGARFLIYAGQFSTSVLGGLTTAGDGIFNTSYPSPVTVSGSRFIFAGAGSLPGSGLDSGSISSNILHNNTTAPALIGFVTALQPPPRNPPPPPPPSLVDLLTMGPPPRNPPPPPPPRANGPLADLSGPDGPNAEPPSSSDQATSYVVGSLEGGPPLVTGGVAGGTIIPRFLRVSTPPPVGTLDDPSLLPGFGNSSLWQ